VVGEALGLHEYRGRVGVPTTEGTGKTGQEEERWGKAGDHAHGRISPEILAMKHDACIMPEDFTSFQASTNHESQHSGRRDEIQANASKTCISAAVRSQLRRHPSTKQLRLTRP
jgi:hypothetical protein